jgi:hypothetical protein
VYGGRASAYNTCPAAAAWAQKIVQNKIPAARCANGDFREIRQLSVQGLAGAGTGLDQLFLLADIINAVTPVTTTNPPTTSSGESLGDSSFAKEPDVHGERADTVNTAPG